MNHNPVGLLIKTYPFLILRFILVALLYLPGYLSLEWGMQLGRRLTGIDLFVFDFMFAYCGFVFFLFYYRVAKMLLLHVLQYAQVGAMTAVLLEKEVKGSLLVYGFKQLLGRFGTVSAMFVAERFMFKVVKEVSSWIIEKGKFLPSFLREGFLSRWVGKSLELTVYHVLEAIVSYLYANPKMNLWEGAIKSTSLYVQSWKSVLKSAFLNTLFMTIFGKVASLIMLVTTIVLAWDKGLLTILAIVITIKITASLLRTAFVEPYETASMLIGFHEGIAGKEPSENIMERLSGSSDKFKRLIFKGKDEGSEFAEKVAHNITEELSPEGDGVFDNIPGWVGDLFKKKGGNSTNEMGGQVQGSNSTEN